MRQRRHPSHEFKSLRQLIGRLWVHDLMYIFNVNSPTELQRALEGVRIKLTDYGYEVMPASGIYVKYHAGRVVPDIETVNWLVKNRCAEAARALDLVLWPILDLKEPIQRNVLEGYLASLSDEVRDVIFQPVSGSRNMVERRPVDVNHLVSELADFGTVDALTAIVAILKERMQLVESDEYLSVLGDITGSGESLFCRLLVFHPFYDVREQLYDYFSSHVFTDYLEVDAEGFVVRREGPPATYLPVTEYLHRLLRQMIELGLVGSMFKEQLNFVSSRFLSDYREAINAAFLKPKPLLLTPSNPLWDLLEKMHHPAVKSRQPISLPLRRADKTTRVANALGDAFIKSRGPEKPFGYPGGIVRRSGQNRSNDHHYRSHWSEDAGRAINLGQRLQLRKPGRMTSETGED